MRRALVGTLLALGERRRSRGAPGSREQSPDERASHGLSFAGGHLTTGLLRGAPTEPTCYSSMMASAQIVMVQPATACAAASVPRATNRSHIATRCLPRLPTARRTSPAIPPAATARRRSRACAGWACSIDELGARCQGLRPRDRRARPRRPAARRPSCSTPAIPGSTIRMLAGILAAHPFAATHRPATTRCAAGRCAASSCRSSAWARASSRDDGRPPLTIHGAAHLTPIDYQPDVPSAQVKSAVLLAGLHAAGDDARHRAARHARPYGAGAADVRRARWSARDLHCRGHGRPAPDGPHTGGAGRYLVGRVLAGRGGALPGSEIVIDGVGLNPTRTGIIDVLRRLGGRSTSSRRCERPRRRAGRHHHGVVPAASATAEIAPDEVPGVIDELPVLAALATHGGELRVTGARSCASRRATASRRCRWPSRAWGATSTSSPTGSTSAAAAGCAAARWTRSTIIAWRWRSRSRRSAPTGPTT